MELGIKKVVINISTKVSERALKTNCCLAFYTPKIPSIIKKKG